SVDSAVEPEAEDRPELLADLLVGPVEVGLRRIEDVQVPLPGLAIGLDDPLPHPAAEDALPVVGRQFAVLTAPVAEHVPCTLAAAGAGLERLLEPDVLVGGVVGDEID